jgi:DNA-binding transcriptional regulator YdaS (Cro superfamily)
MDLSKYIETIGDHAASKLFGVSYWTARSWRLGTRVPRARKAREVVRATGGKVGLSGIYRAEKAES